MAHISRSILVVYTEKSRDEDFDNILTRIKSGEPINDIVYDCHECNSFEKAAELLTNNTGIEFDIVLIHLLAPDEKELWRKIYYKTRTHNKFSEVIIVIKSNSEVNKMDPGEVLSSGCFAFFEYKFNPDVLLGYIKSAGEKSESRKNRAVLSREINEAKTLKEISQKIAQNLRELTNYDNITITLFKKGRIEQGYLRKLLLFETSAININKYNSVNWELLRPTKADELIDNILSGSIKKRVFPNPATDEEIKHLFNKNNETPLIKSWIVLPLQHAGENIGLITLDSFKENWFSYENIKINEVALEQIANQAAAAIRYAEQSEVHEKLRESLSVLNSSNHTEEILQKLAEQARKVVDGLFSYIVVPDQTGTHLKFEAAWSRHIGKNYIQDLRSMVTFQSPITGEIKSGFLLSPYNTNKEGEKGITTIAFEKKDMQILEYIQDPTYQETSSEARREYYEFLYKYNDNGVMKKLPSNSDIALPIIGNDNNIFGVINVEHEDPFAFTQEHINALKNLAEFAAIAIGNRKEQELIERLFHAGDIEIPNDENLSFDKTRASLDKLAEKVRHASKAKYVSVFSVKDNKSFLIGTTNRPPQDIQEGSRQGNSDTEGHTFWCVRNKKPVIINDTTNYQSSPKNYRDPLGSVYQRQNGTYININERTNLTSIRALVCIPMLLPNNEAVGVIWMHHEFNPDYTREEIELFQIYANRAANIIALSEKLNFLNIEINIRSTHDKDSILKEIIESAKNYFGLRGAAIYEANSKKETLTRVKSNIKQFHANQTISYSQDNPQGLAGHLMQGIDIENYPYKSGYCHIPDYQPSKYAHAIRYDDEKIKELGSVVGIRMPLNNDPSEAIGVLIVADEVGRNYDKSKEDLIKFADIAGKCLQAIEEEKRAIQAPAKTMPTPEEKVEALEKRVASLVLFIALVAPILILIILKLVDYPLPSPSILWVVGLSISYLICITNKRLRDNQLLPIILSIITNLISSLMSQY